MLVVAVNGSCGNMGRSETRAMFCAVSVRIWYVDGTRVLVEPLSSLPIIESMTVWDGERAFM